MPLAPYCINFQVQTIETPRSVFRPGFYHSLSQYEPVVPNSFVPRSPQRESRLLLFAG